MSIVPQTRPGARHPQRRHVRNATARFDQVEGVVEASSRRALMKGGAST